MHDRFTENWLAVIADRDGAGRLERAVFGQRFTHAAAGGRRDGKDAGTGIAFDALHPARGFNRIVDRNGVGHGADGGESTRRGCRGSGCNRLLISLPGLPQVNVDIDQAWRNHQTFGFYDLRICLLAGGGQLAGRLDGGPPAILEQQVAIRVHSSGGVNQAAAANQDRAQARPLFLTAGLARSAALESAFGEGLTGRKPFNWECSGAKARWIKAMRMATPFVTCSAMTDCGPSATSLVISSPRIIGPGCITMACGAQSSSRSW